MKRIFCLLALSISLCSHAQNVGIGTAAPAYKLDVNGAVNSTTGYKIAGASPASNTYLKGNGTYFVAGTIAASDVPLLNQSTTGNAAGFTGALAGDVTGTQTTTNLSRIQGTTLTVSSLASGNVLQYNGRAWVNVAVSALTANNIYNSDGTLTANRTVAMAGYTLNLSGGNVGIGTAPNDKFDVLASGGRDVLIGGGATNGSELKLSYSGNAHFSIYNNGTSKLTIANTSALINTNTAGTALLTVDVSGNTLIPTGTLAVGTTSAPAEKIRAVDAGNANVYSGTLSVLANNLSQGVGIGYQGIAAIGSNSTQDLSFQSKSTGNLNFYTNGAERMIMLGSNGYVGVGTTAPVNTFTVNGSGGFYNSNQINFYTDAGVTPKGFVGENSSASDMMIASVGSGNWMRIGANAANIAFFPDNTIYSSTTPKVFITPAGNTTTSQLTVGNANGGTGTGTTFNNMQAGSTAVPTLSGCTGGGCVQTMTISYSFPSGVTPNIICTVQSQSGTSYNDVYVTQVRSKSNTSATINICRQDAYYNGEGWGQNASLSWIAWY